MDNPLNPKKLFLIAGEPSGDLQGALLAKELKRLNPQIELVGMGGPEMRSAGVSIFVDVTSLALVGFFGVLRHLKFFLGLLSSLTQEIERTKPNAVILIDYPGFNLRLAKEIKKRGIPVIYYISPQIWAWRKGRVNKIAKRVDKMICFFDFEKALYEEKGLPTTWVGHPFVDVVRPEWPLSEAKKRFQLREGVPTIGILPGSRKHEVKRHLPILAQAAERLQDRLGPCQFLISQTQGVSPELYHLPEAISKKLTGHVFLKDHFYDLIQTCDLVLVVSGSSTLITGILGKPMIVIYSVNTLTAWIIRYLIQIRHIALANIVAGHQVVPELLQEKATPKAIADEAYKLMTNGRRREEMKQALLKMKNRLGPPGAAHRAASEILKSL